MKSKLEIISLDRIHDPERPMRSNLTPESVDELVFSIKEVGIIQPLVVSKTDTGFEVIAGHRRLFAAEIAGLTEAPCIVVEAENMDREVLKMHENIAREDINPIDWANHLAYLKQQYNLDNAKLAELTGFSVPWVQQHLEILNYPEEVLEAIKADKLAFSAARELSQIKDPAKRKVYTNAAVRGGVTPGMAANWRRQANAQTPAPVNSETGAEVPMPENVPQPTELVCPVCREPIPSTEIVTLYVHAKCQPSQE